MPSSQSGNHSTTQAQLLADYFRADGYEVKSVSGKQTRIGRFVDVLYTVVRDRGRIDILLIEVYSGLSFVLADLASWIGKLFGIPSVLALHGGNLPEFASQYPRWVKRVLDRARVIVAPSSFLATAIGRTGHFVKVIPNVLSACPEITTTERPSTPRLLWMRSFHAIYNPLMAVQAFGLLKQKFPEATMVMAGSDKGLESTTREYARDKGLADSISFPGFLAEERKAEVFSDANIYINTNTIDNSPVSVIEAWSYGLPVVSTDVGGIPYMVTEGVTGLLVSSGDAEGMAAKIERLMTDPDLAASLSRNGRKMAERSTWDSVGPQWANVFDEARRKAKTSEIEQLA